MEMLLDLPPGLIVSIEDRPSESDRNAIEDALIEFNRPHFRDSRIVRLAVLVRNERREIVAGLDSATYAGWLFVDNLWVHAELRGRGIGRELLTQAERYAAERGCHSAWLDTFSFQAPEFYRRLGYEVFGTLDYPPDHWRFFLNKRLSAPDDPSSSELDRVHGHSEMRFPVSVKGVLLDGDGVVLLENERQEWELPGGRLEQGEDPADCLRREFAEELGADIIAEAMLDCWLYQVLPQKEVLIVTYGVRRLDRRALQVSREHRRLGAFAVNELDALPMPEGYRRSIRAWMARRGA